MGNVPSVEEPQRAPQRLSKHMAHKPSRVDDNSLANSDTHATPTSPPTPPPPPSLAEDPPLADSYFLSRPSLEARFGTTTVITAENNSASGELDGGGIALIRRLSKRASPKPSSITRSAALHSRHNSASSEQQEPRLSVTRAATSPSLIPDSQKTWIPFAEACAVSKSPMQPGQVPGMAIHAQEPVHPHPGLKPRPETRDRSSYHQIYETREEPTTPMASRHFSLPAVPPDLAPSQRAATPSDTDYGFLGAMVPGSLHITNGAPSPAISDRGPTRSPLTHASARTQPSVTSGLDFGFDEPKVLRNRSRLPSCLVVTAVDAACSQQPGSSDALPDLVQGDGGHPSSASLPGDCSASRTYSDSGYSSMTSPRRGSKSPIEEVQPLTEKTTVTSDSDGDSSSRKGSSREGIDSSSTRAPSPTREEEEEDQTRGRPLSKLTRRLSSISLHLPRSKSRGAESTRSVSRARAKHVTDSSSAQADGELTAQPSSTLRRLLSRRRHKSQSNIHTITQPEVPVPAVPKDIDGKLCAVNTEFQELAEKPTRSTWHSERQQIIESKQELASADIDGFTTDSSVATNFDGSTANSSSPNISLTNFPSKFSGGSDRDSSLGRHGSKRKGHRLRMQSSISSWKPVRRVTGKLDDEEGDEIYSEDQIIDEAQIYNIQTAQAVVGHSAFDQAFEAMTGDVPAPRHPVSNRGSARHSSMTANMRSVRRQSLSQGNLKSHSSAPALRGRPHSFNLVMDDDLDASPTGKPPPPVSMRPIRATSVRLSMTGRPQIVSIGGSHHYPGRAYEKENGNSNGNLPHWAPSSHGFMPPRSTVSSVDAGYPDSHRQSFSRPLWRQSRAIPEHDVAHHARTQSLENAFHYPRTPRRDRQQGRHSMQPPPRTAGVDYEDDRRLRHLLGTQTKLTRPPSQTASHVTDAANY